MKIYAIKDSSAAYWLPPFTARNDAHAIRMFAQSMGEMFRFRDDFSLFAFGEWNDDLGELTAFDGAEIVVHGSGLSESFNPDRLAQADNQPAKELN